MELTHLDMYMADSHGFIPDPDLIGRYLLHTGRERQYIIIDYTWMGDTDEWGYVHKMCGEFGPSITRPLSHLCGKRKNGEMRYAEWSEYTMYAATDPLNDSTASGAGNPTEFNIHDAPSHDKNGGSNDWLDVIDRPDLKARGVDDNPTSKRIGDDYDERDGGAEPVDDGGGPTEAEPTESAQGAGVDPYTDTKSS